MKKFLLSMLSFVMTVAVYAGTYTLTTNSSASTWTGDANSYTTTINGWKLTYEKANSTSDCIAPKSDHIRVYKNARFTIAPATASSETIVKVVLSCTATDYAKTPSTDSGSVSASGTTVTWEGTANQVILNTTGSQLRIKTIEITTAATGAVLAPSITPNGGEYVEGDKAEVVITAGEGQDIYYTLNNDNLNASEEYTGETIEITSNTTVYAWASDGTQTSEAATATFNFTAPLGNIAAFNALEKGKAAKFISTLTAVYQNGSNLIVKDDSGTMLIYGNVGQTYNNGDVIAAGVRGYVGEYGGNKQLSPTANSFTAGVAGTAVAPVKKTVAELANCSFLEYVKLEGVYFTLVEGKTKNYTVSDGTNSFAAYNQFGLTLEGLAEGATYNVEGFMSSYNGTAQLQPTKITTSSGGEIGPGDDPGTETPDNLGTKEAPITVTEALAAYVDGEEKDAWVTGYIVGCVEGSKLENALFGLPAELKSNILIAATVDCKDITKCIPVQLPTGAVRNGLNLVDNPTHLGKKVTLNGSIMKYFLVAGIKNTKEYVLENSSAIEKIGTDVNAPVEYYNLQGVKVANPENGIFIKKQGSRTTKVVL